MNQKSRIFFLAMLVIVIVAGLVSFFRFQKEFMHHARSVGLYIQSNFWVGAAIFIFSFGIISLFMIPSGFLTIMGGIVFRPIYFSVGFALLGSQVGILLSILIGKSLLRPYVVSLFATNKRVRAVDIAIQKEGFKVVTLLRMTPVFPFGFCNYFLSGTGLDLKTIVLGSLLGNLPGSIINSFIGSLIGDLTREDTETPIRIQALTWLFSIVFTVGAMVFIGILSKKAFRDMVDLEKIEGQASFIYPTASTPLNVANQVRPLQANSLLVNLAKLGEIGQFQSDQTKRLSTLHNQPIVISVEKLEAQTTALIKSDTTNNSTQPLVLDNYRPANNITPGSDILNNQVRANDNDEMLGGDILIEIVEPASKGYTKNERITMYAVAFLLFLALAIGIPAIFVLTPEPQQLK